MTSAFGIEHEISKYSKAYGTNRLANEELNEKGIGKSPKLRAVKMITGPIEAKKRKKKVAS